MPEINDHDQNKKRNRDPDTNVNDQSAKSSSSGIRRDSAGRAIDNKMQEDEAQRNNKRPSNEESGAQEREKKVLATAPDQGIKRPRDDDDDIYGTRSKMDVGVNQVECEEREQYVKNESLMKKQHDGLQEFVGHLR